MLRFKEIHKDERLPVFVVAALIFLLSWALKPYPNFPIPYFLLGNITIGLAFLLWRMRKQSFWKSAVLFILIMITIYQFEPNGDFEGLLYWIVSLFITLCPVLFALLVNKILKNKMEAGYRKAFVYFFTTLSISAIITRLVTGELKLENLFWIPVIIETVLWSIWFCVSDDKSWKTRLFRFALALSILIGWMYIIYNDWDSWWINRYLINPIIIICLPIIEFIIIRAVNNCIKTERKNRTSWIVCLYFLANILLFFFTVIHSFAWQSHIHGPSRAAYEVCMYFIPVMLLVFWHERKHIYENVHSMRDCIRDILSSGVYVCVCVVTLFATNFRIRTILFDLGMPAIGVYDENRLDYIPYRMECLKAYFSGNTETIKKLSFINEYDPVKEAYGSIDSIGLGTFSAGWYWLIVLVFLWAVLLVFLVKIRTEDRNKKQMMRYLIAAYAIRGLLSICFEIFLVTPTIVLFPFSRETGMEFMILFLLLRYFKGVDNNCLEISNSNNSSEVH